VETGQAILTRGAVDSGPTDASAERCVDAALDIQYSMKGCQKNVKEMKTVLEPVLCYSYQRDGRAEGRTMNVNAG
jgi:hypothetical protein